MVLAEHVTFYVLLPYRGYVEHIHNGLALATGIWYLPSRAVMLLELDFNNNGTIDMADFIHMLSHKPPYPKTMDYIVQYENSGR